MADQDFKSDVHQSILDYLQEQLEQNPNGKSKPLSLKITADVVNNKTGESSQSGVILENEDGPYFVKGHEPMLNQQYRILTVDEHWTEDDWWRSCANPPLLLDVALALAAEYINTWGIDAPLVFDNRKLAVLYYLNQLQSEPDEDFCRRLTELLKNLS